MLREGESQAIENDPEYVQVRSKRFIATAALLTLLAAGVFVLAGTLWAQVPNIYPLAPAATGSNGQELAQREATRTSAIVTTRTSILAGLAGLGAILTVAINSVNSRTSLLTLRETARSYASSERDRRAELNLKQQEAAEARNDAEERRITELYVAAAEQLGSNRASVRLAGLYALERLAQSSPSQRGAILELLCAYLRIPASEDETERRSLVPDARVKESDDDDRTEKERERDYAYAAGTTRRDVYSVAEQQVRSAAVKLLARHRRRGDPESFWESATPLDISRSDLRFADFSNCDFSAAILQQSDFTGSNLDFIDLSSADIRSCIFRELDMKSANLAKAHATGSTFIHARLEGSNLRNAVLLGATFYNSDFVNVDLHQAWIEEDAFYSQVGLQPNGKFEGPDGKVWTDQRALRKGDGQT